MKPIFFTMLVFATAAAQDHPAIPVVQSAAFVSSSATLKSVPQWDRKFTALVAADAAVMLWDEGQTMNCLHHFVGCRETNPAFGPHPSAARLYGTAIAIDAGYILASYELRRHGPERLRRLWYAGAAWVIEQHVQGIAQSARR